MHLRTLTFSLDNTLSPLTRILPNSPLPHLPRPISHFLGYRSPSSTTQIQPLGNVLVSLWSFLGAFVGLVAVAGLFESSWISSRGAPLIVGSFGAGAVLEFNAIESPFSQPRNALLGQTLASVIGVGITKLFYLQPNSATLTATLSPSPTLPSPNAPPPYASLAAALSVALSSMVMSLTGTIYPPAGATALLAATEPSIIGLGWLYVGIVVLGTVVMLAVAALVNNIMRRYPIYWWAPMQATASTSSTQSSNNKPLTDKSSSTDEEASLEGAKANVEGRLTISVGSGVIIPQGLHLSGEEWRILRILEMRMREVYDGYEQGRHDGHGQSEAGSDEGKSHDENVQHERRSQSLEARGRDVDDRLNRVETFDSTSTLRDQSATRYGDGRRESSQGLK